MKEQQSPVKKTMIFLWLNKCFFPGLLEEHTLRRCKRVCQPWKHLTDETMQEIKFRRIFQDQIKAIMEVENLNDFMISES